MILLHKRQQSASRLTESAPPGCALSDKNMVQPSTGVLYLNLMEMSRQPDAGRLEVQEITARSILTETRGFTSVEIPDTGFHYSLNPYRGCAFDCSYCYAPAFVFDDQARNNWGRWVAVKTNAEALLRSAGRRGKLRNKNVYMSTSI